MKHSKVMTLSFIIGRKKGLKIGSMCFKLSKMAILQRTFCKEAHKYFLWVPNFADP